MNKELRIEDLHVFRDGQEIISGVSLAIRPGEVHALMGPNGSGKSTLANALMGHPSYEITSGRILVDGQDVTKLPPHERAKLGMFLSMQYPPEIPGVTVAAFLRAALNSLRGEPMPVLEFRSLLREKMSELEIDFAFARRHLNEGFSGGEKKRAEVLQMSVLGPKYAILDETDSGLDIDAFKVVADGINRMKSSDTGILLITHYTRMLKHVTPDKVHVMKAGKIARTGGKELAEEIERDGFDMLQIKNRPV